MIKLESASWPKDTVIPHKSKVHSILASLNVPIRKEELVYRSLVPEDVPELIRLESEWFPNDYSGNLYREIADKQRIALGCFWKAVNGQSLMMGAVIARYETSSDALLYVGKEKIIGVESRCTRVTNYFRNWRNENLYITTIGVIDEARRLGIATTFLNILYEKAKERPNCISISLHVKENNYPARKCYERNEYIHVFTVPNYYRYKKESSNGLYYIKVVKRSLADLSLLDKQRV